MGQKYSIDITNWTIDDWAFGTGGNFVQLKEVIEELKQAPVVNYFGSRAIANDASMQKMQLDLLSFDDKLKRIFFRRKKNKRSKKQNYDQNQQLILEEDEYQFLPTYTETY